MKSRTGLLGAEKQAATSAALAYPELRLVFYTDCPVLDGWDLSNVEIAHVTRDDIDSVAREHEEALIPLCPSWTSPALASPSNRIDAFGLLRVMAELHHAFGDSAVLPVTTLPGSDGSWIAKGDRWHKQDAVIVGSAADVLAAGEDPHGCGIVFQPYLEASKTYIATGVRASASTLDIAVFRALSEVFCREPVIAAAETVAQPRLIDLCCDVLDHIDHRGWFTMNWLERDGAFRLSSMRPVPCATFGAMRRAGLDSLLEPSHGRRVARPNVRMIADNHYSTYKPLS